MLQIWQTKARRTSQASFGLPCAAYQIAGPLRSYGEFFCVDFLRLRARHGARARSQNS